MAGVDPAAVAAQVDLDQDRQIYPGLNGGGRVGGDLVRVVGQDGDVGRLGQGAEAAQFLSPDDLVGYQDVLDPGVGHHLGLADLFGSTTPIAPAAICRRAAAGHLWVLAWGRKAISLSARESVMVLMFCSNRSRSRSRAGVSTSEMCWPIWAGGAGLRHGVILCRVV